MRLRILNQHFHLSEAWRLRRAAWGLLSARRAVNAARVWAAWRSRAERVPGLPPVMMIEVSSACDMRCPMCPATLHPSGRRTGLMDVELYRAIMDEVGRDLAVMTPWNFGEPLLHPRLPEMIEIAKAKGVLVGLNTNALSLDRDRADALIRSGVDSVALSIDGATRETYERFRGEGNFERVCANAAQFVERRRALRSPTPLITLQFIVMRENEHEVPAIQRLAEKWGVDKVALKRFTYLEDNGERFRPADARLSMSRQTMREPCSRLWLSTTILSDGRVTTCCGDLGFDHVMGTLGGGTSVADVWNGEAYRAMRRLAKRGMQSVAMCRTCPSYNFSPGMFLDSPSG